ncbi:hypothetical protein AB1N83_009317 [Pleurotus pulmonarius]
MPEAPELIPRACHNVKMNSDPESLLVRVSEVSKPTRGTRYLVNITKYLIESVWCASLPYNSISTSWRYRESFTSVSWTATRLNTKVRQRNGVNADAKFTRGRSAVDVPE